MKYKLYHNPRCSKSREAVEYLNSQKIDCDILNYIKDGLNKENLLEIINKSDLKPIDLVRKQEKIWKQSNIDFDSPDNLVLDAIIKFPVILHRPILVSKKKAIIARPVTEILKITGK